MSRVIVGVDPHKKSVTIEVVDEQGAVLATGRFDTTSVGYRLMKTYVGEWPRRRWGTEGANGMGRPLAQRLLAQGETVLDVPAKLAVRLGVFETHSTSQRTSRWPPRRDRGSLDRGLLGRQPGSALRVRTGGGACARCPAGDRRKRHRDRPHWSIRGFVRGRPDIEETIRRLRGYAEAGADCRYAPRIDNLEHVAAIVSAVSPKPVNLLNNAPFTTVGQAAALGVRRISFGGTLARTA